MREPLVRGDVARSRRARSRSASRGQSADPHPVEARIADRQRQVARAGTRSSANPPAPSNRNPSADSAPTISRDSRGGNSRPERVVLGHVEVAVLDRARRDRLDELRDPRLPRPLGLRVARREGRDQPRPAPPGSPRRIRTTTGTPANEACWDGRHLALGRALGVRPDQGAVGVAEAAAAARPSGALTRHLRLFAGGEPGLAPPGRPLGVRRADPCRVRLDAHSLEARQRRPELRGASVGETERVAGADVELVDLREPVPCGRLGVVRALGECGGGPELAVQRVLAGGDRARVGIGLGALDALAERVVGALRVAQGLRGGARLVRGGRGHGAPLVGEDRLVAHGSVSGVASVAPADAAGAPGGADGPDGSSALPAIGTSRRSAMTARPTADGAITSGASDAGGRGLRRRGRHVSRPGRGRRPRWTRCASCPTRRPARSGTAAVVSAPARDVRAPGRPVRRVPPAWRAERAWRRRAGRRGSRPRSTGRSRGQRERVFHRRWRTRGRAGGRRGRDVRRGGDLEPSGVLG